MLTLVRPERQVPVQRQPSRLSNAAHEGPVVRTSLRAPAPGVQTVASDAGVTAEWAAMAWVSEDGRWWLCRERPGPTHFAELVARRAAFALDTGQAVVCVGSWERGRDRRALLDLARRHRGTSALVRTSDTHRWPEAARGMRHDISATASVETVARVVLGALEASHGR